MNIQRLRIFIDLAKTLNYTETAENLYTTQGNISKHILALEKELSVSLFNRSHRKISLTREGEITLEYAKKIISESNELQSKLLAYQDEKNSNIQMYTIPTMPNYKSFALISEFLKSYPQIHIQLREEESQNLFTALNSRQCEMIFARTFTELDDNLEKITMEHDNFVAVLSKSHPLSKMKKIDLKELADERFLILGKTTNLYEPFLKLCKMADFDPQITYEGSRADLIVQMVEKQMGVSIMVEKTARNFLNDKIAIVPLTKNIDNQLGFIRLRGQHTKANEIFWNYAKINTL